MEDENKCTSLKIEIQPFDLSIIFTFYYTPLKPIAIYC